jgi:hypothetical protein
MRPTSAHLLNRGLFGAGLQLSDQALRKPLLEPEGETFALCRFVSLFIRVLSIKLYSHCHSALSTLTVSGLDSKMPNLCGAAFIQPLSCLSARNSFPLLHNL